VTYTNENSIVKILFCEILQKCRSIQPNTKPGIAKVQININKMSINPITQQLRWRMNTRMTCMRTKRMNTQKINTQRKSTQKDVKNRHINKNTMIVGREVKDICSG